MIHQWAFDNPDGLIAWAANKQFPDQVGKMIDSQVIDGQIESIVHHEEDFQSALSSVQALPEEIRQSALSTLLDRWAQKTKQTAAREWLQSLPAGDAKDQMISSYHALDNPAQTLALAGQITNQKTQAAFINKVFAGWAHLNPQAAGGWLGQSSLPEPTKTELRKALNR